MKNQNYINQLNDEFDPSPTSQRLGVAPKQGISPVRPRMPKAGIPNGGNNPYDPNGPSPEAERADEIFKSNVKKAARSQADLRKGVKPGIQRAAQQAFKNKPMKAQDIGLEKMAQAAWILATSGKQRQGR